MLPTARRKGGLQENSRSYVHGPKGSEIPPSLAIMQAYDVLVGAEAPPEEDSMSPTNIELLPHLDGHVPLNFFPELTDVLLYLSSM